MTGCGNCGHSIEGHASGRCADAGVHPHGPDQVMTEFRCRCSSALSTPPGGSVEGGGE